MQQNVSKGTAQLFCKKSCCIKLRDSMGFAVYHVLRQSNARIFEADSRMRKKFSLWHATYIANVWSVSVGLLANV
ncbi:hypothetical protein CMV_006341 [Castanea mollissima]|uniref:Uncharacterized protein n=1 Tax=Castanea mollissima TaxID=60419 RepID=A0A8J4RVN1_9ROSI|nr:hypothetical protein CMV_006341 [Castanea mollissima]